MHMNFLARPIHITCTAHFWYLSASENMKHLFHSCLTQPWLTFAAQCIKPSRIHQETKQHSIKWWKTWPQKVSLWKKRHPKNRHFLTFYCTLPDLLLEHRGDLKLWNAIHYWPQMQHTRSWMATVIPQACHCTLWPYLKYLNKHLQKQKEKWENSVLPKPQTMLLNYSRENT